MSFVPIIDPAVPNCPLCDTKFIRVFVDRQEYYICKRDMISINVKDPFVGRWKEIDNKDEPLLCDNPKCRGRLKWFGRSDGYMKAICPNKKCGFTVEITGEEIKK